MGQTAFVKSPTRPLVAGKLIRPFSLHLDLPLVVTVLVLIVIGLMMVYSASWKSAAERDLPDTYYLGRQIVSVLIGIAAALALSVFDYHRFKNLLLPMVGGAIGLLLLVIVIGEDRNNATRTLLNGSIQPSEIAVLALIIYLSFWLYLKREVLNIISFGLIPMTTILGIFAGLVWIQPDFSAAITIMAIGGILFYLAGAEFRQLILVLVAAVLIGYFISTSTATGSSRIANYLAGLTDPQKASDHMKWVFTAITNGGLFGVGIGNSTTKFIGLPVPWTDSIYAVIIEETGILGGSVILALYMFFLWRGMDIARRASDQLGRLLAIGITFWITFNALLNMGVIVNLFPFAGNALPLVSYGGSSMFSTLAGIGILMNIANSTSTKKIAQSEGRSFGAVIDLRRRDRRRRVSRPGGSGGTGE